MNWKEHKWINSTVIRVDRLDPSALFLLYENSLRMGNESNNNVSLASLEPSSWLEQISEVILEYVSYVSKFPCFEIGYFHNNTWNVESYNIEGFDELNSIDELKDFIKERGKKSTFVLYYIINYVDLNTMRKYWLVKSKSVSFKIDERDKKIKKILKSKND